MTDIKFTEGSWDFDNEIYWVNQPGEQEIRTGNFEVSNDGGETIIANVNGQIKAGKANAHLMAAAPAMYEALAHLLEFADRTGQGNAKQVENARAALALARGETQ